MISKYCWPTKYDRNPKEGVRILLDENHFAQDCVFGKTKIFIRSPKTVFELEERRSAKIPELVILLQRVKNNNQKSEYENFRRIKLIP